jgi:putative DNA primase/helicase
MDAEHFDDEAAFQSAIAELAALPPLAFAQRRGEIAKSFKAPLALVDRQVREWRRDMDAQRRRKAAEDRDDEAPARPPEFSDDALALRFSDRHGAALRYVAGWGRWMLFDGIAWREDSTLAVFDKARVIAREAAETCNDMNVAGLLTSAKTVAAVERLARSDRRHAATADQWDSDLWLLNTPGGTVDLRTGKPRAHRSGDYMTKTTAVAPGGECPLFLKFLDRITDGDGELQSYLQRVFGYCLTGITTEHALFFGHGTGRNGKGVLLGALGGLMGEYAVVATMEVFMASANDRHTTDIAMLRGARLVTAQETEEGRRLAEARIKAITGGDPITARFMRQDNFTYMPQFKPFIAGNHKPGLRGVDEAIRARLHMIPFTVTIPKPERDRELPEKLKAEWPGILAWAIEGCLKWQRIGLAPPEAVTSATEHYLDAEDSLGAWLGERTRKNGYGATETSRLFADWTLWAKAAGEDPGTLKRFGQALEDRGYVRKQNWSTRRSEIEGLALADVEPSWAEPEHERA